MKGCNILFPINKKGNVVGQEGYVLGITLIVLTIALLLVASFIKRQTYHEDWTRTLQQAASTKLVGQDCLESNKDEVARRFDKALRKTWSECKEVYKPANDSERKAIQWLAAAKAYVEVSQSFFHGIPSGGSFSESYVIKQEFSFRTPHLEQGVLTEVMSYNYVGDTLFISSLSKKEFVAYKSILKKIKDLEQSFTKDETTIESKRVEIESIQGEIESKLLYEVVADVTVKNSDLEVLDKVKMYLTLKLMSNEDEELPYRLTVDEYVMDYK